MERRRCEGGRPRRNHALRYNLLQRGAMLRSRPGSCATGRSLPSSSRKRARRGWATARKYLPDLDVAAAGGWKETTSLKRAYQQADEDTMLEVVMGARKLRERQA